MEIHQLNTNNYVITFLFRGEMTQAVVTSRYDTFVEGFGQVTRHPNDVPNTQLGKKYALTQALKNSSLSREQRTEIWGSFKLF